MVKLNVRCCSEVSFTNVGQKKQGNIEKNQVRQNKRKISKEGRRKEMRKKRKEEENCKIRHDEGLVVNEVGK